MGLLSRSKLIYSKQMWRLRQSQTIIQMIFFSLTLAGVYMPYVKAVIALPSVILLAMLSTFSLLCLLLLGIIYDSVLGLWKEDNIIMTKKNPYAIDQFSEKDIDMMKTTLIFNTGVYNILKSNIELCKKNNIDTKSYEIQLKEFEKTLHMFNKWIIDGRITEKPR